MLIFWMIAAGLTLLAIAFVVPPLLKKTVNTTDVDRNSLNVAIYKERLAELEQENLTPEQLTAAKQELEKTLVQDLDDKGTPVHQARARWVTTLIVALGIPVLAMGSYWKLGSWDLLTAAPPTETHLSSQANESASNFDKTIQKLRDRLQRQPNDTEGWYMLARSYTFLKRYDKAAEAYNKLLGLVGENDPQLLSDLARVLALSNGGQFADQANILLKTALELDPNHQQTLWLSGLAALQKTNYKAAIDYWQHFLRQLSPEEVKTRQTLEKQIAKARRALEQTTSTVMEPTTQTAPVIATHKPTSIEVQVNLDPALQNKVKSSDTLFIYARTLEGSPMPLAILKHSANVLPITVTLDDSMAMMPTMKLSNFKAISLFARISSSGSATLQSGDFQGQVSPVVLEKQTRVTVTINQKVP